ncbi:hypothetical protein BaRGS_00037284 [Batillaria attramentaria]|uniref:Uncharacterized protein n=1 Tax=Batillaria attramentaria TaxID=370345 RepID=A0ABD0J9K3_9CAEN
MERGRGPDPGGDKSRKVWKNSQRLSAVSCAEEPPAWLMFTEVNTSRNGERSVMITVILFIPQTLLFSPRLYSRHISSVGCLLALTVQTASTHVLRHSGRQLRLAWGSRSARESSGFKYSVYSKAKPGSL